ncbi:MAG TPA: DUF1697 domain-containing protein [Vicinamibacterales bacterium]|nr:DUF1697 domain-containing protein [Vicinamibacterales bacterium]
MTRARPTRAGPRSPRARPPGVYVALLRGINVGGRNLVSMNALKGSFERLGLRDVVTYLNSGNVLFRSDESDARRLEDRLEPMLADEHRLPIRTIVRSHADMGRLIETISATWRPDPHWRYNVIFLRRAIDTKRILDGVDPKKDIEHVVYCPGTLLWSARLNALTRTAMLKFGRLPVYQDVTVRSVNTTTRIFELMQRMARDAPEV